MLFRMGVAYGVERLRDEGDRDDGAQSGEGAARRSARHRRMPYRGTRRLSARRPRSGVRSETALVRTAEGERVSRAGHAGRFTGHERRIRRIRSDPLWAKPPQRLCALQRRTGSEAVKTLIFALSLLSSAIACQSAFAEGDSARGSRAFRACAACHSVDANRNMTGPSLAGVINRKAGSLPGFSRYSEPMKNS